VAPARAEEKARAGELFKLISKSWTVFAERISTLTQVAEPNARPPAPVPTAEQSHANAMELE
jgi:hypothetical protein